MSNYYIIIYFFSFERPRSDYAPSSLASRPPPFERNNGWSNGTPSILSHSTTILSQSGTSNGGSSIQGGTGTGGGGGGGGGGSKGTQQVTIPKDVKAKLNKCLSL